MSEVRESLLGKAGRLVRRRPILCVASTLVLAVVIVVVAFVAYAGYFVYRLHVLHGQRVEKTFAALEGYGGADAFYEKCKKIASRLPFDEGMSFTGMRLRQGDSSTENGRSNDVGCIWRELSELDPQYVVKESGSKCLVIQVSGGFMHMGLVVALGDDYLGTDKFPAVWDASGDWSWKRLGKYVYWYEE